MVDDIDQAIEQLTGESVSGGESADQGTHFGSYHVLHPIGQGGLGTVYRARHVHPSYSSQSYALKVMKAEVATDPDAVSLFKQEAFIMAMLRHPNVVRTVEAGFDNDRLFIAMEYVSGRDLRGLMGRAREMGERLPQVVALHLINSVVDGLCAAHALTDTDGERLGLVHRDINPSNVFISYDGHVKLGDFGVVALAAGRENQKAGVYGTPGYLAPEAIRDQAVDQRGDLFAVGVILYELLVGEVLFDGDGLEAVVASNERARVPDMSSPQLDISQGLRDVVLRALARDPAKRYATAEELRDALRPLAPTVQGMRLGVSSLMRRYFRQQFNQESQMQVALGEVDLALGTGRLVAVCADDTPRRTGVVDQLLGQGYWTEVNESIETMSRSLEHGMPPCVIVWDVGSRAFPSDDLVSAVSSAKAGIPIVAVSPQLSVDAIAGAHAVGARELVVSHDDPEQLLSAIYVAASRAAKVDTADEAGESAASELSVALVSRDAAVIGELKPLLGERGMHVTVFEGAAELAEAQADATYGVAVCDAGGDIEQAVACIEVLRGVPGVADLPVLLLVDDSSAGSLPLANVATRVRSDPAVVIANSLDALLSTPGTTRRFVRYESTVPVDVQTMGRQFIGLVVDVSRGGLGIRSSFMPTVDASVTVEFPLPDGSGTVETHGRVCYAGKPSETGTEVEFGVRFTGFGRGHESVWIAMITALCEQVSTTAPSA